MDTFVLHAQLLEINSIGIHLLGSFVDDVGVLLTDIIRAFKVN